MADTTVGVTHLMATTEHLIPAVWAKPINSIEALKAALRNGKEFTVSSAYSKWHGATTTGAELRAEGITHVQVRYGAKLQKAWYGEIPK